MQERKDDWNDRSAAKTNRNKRQQVCVPRFWIVTDEEEKGTIGIRRVEFTRCYVSSIFLSTQPTEIFWFRITNALEDEQI